MKFPSVARGRKVTLLFITFMRYWQPFKGETQDRFRYTSYLRIYESVFCFSFLLHPEIRRIIPRSRDESH